MDESEKEAMRGNVKVMLPNVSDDEYNQMEAEVIDKFIDLGDEDANESIRSFIRSIKRCVYF